VLELILLVGLAALYAAHWKALARLRQLEKKLEALSGKPSAQLVQREATGEQRIAGAAPAVSSSPPVKETLAALFERFVGGRLLIWIGGIALAAAGIFLVRHSIELVTPEARMIAASLLGLILIGAGEYARAGRFLADDPRIGQSLVGAGIAILYATTYGSHLLFGLIGSGTASALMLAITGVALGLSLRHGAPTAAIGIIGGFLTPLLVGDAKAGALPVLSYLALLDLAIFAIAWRRGWSWLVAAAVGASFAWSGYFVLEQVRDAQAAGVFALLLAIAASLPQPQKGRPLSLIQPAIIGLVQLAVLVARSDIGPVAWLLFGILAAASLPIAALRPGQRLAPVAALAFALVLIAFKSFDRADALVPWVAILTTLLFAGGSALAARTQPLAAVTACAALAGPIFILRLLRPDLLSFAAWGGLALALGAAALLLLRLLRGRGRSGVDVGAFAPAATATLLFALAGHDLAPRDFISLAWLLTAAGLLFAGVRMPDKPLRFAGLLLLTATILKVFLIDASKLEGVLRILSFLGLGIALIGIGKLYSKVLSAKPSDRPPAERVESA
jgi:uncharacterized membrane protein